MQTVSLQSDHSSFSTIYLNMDDKVSPSGLWRDTPAFSADVKRHWGRGGVCVCVLSDGG